MDEFNPYASPQSDVEDAATRGGLEDVGVWRMNDLLVVRKGWVLPYRCVKSNEPAVRTVKRRLTWAPSWVGWVLTAPVVLGSFAPYSLAASFGLPLPAVYRGPRGIYGVIMIAVLVSLLLQRRYTIRLPLGEVWLAKRRKHTMLSIGFTAAVLAIVSGYIPPLIAFPGLVLVCFALLMLGYFKDQAFVESKRLTRDFAYLKGAHPAYLDQLADWPHADYR